MSLSSPGVRSERPTFLQCYLSSGMVLIDFSLSCLCVFRRGVHAVARVSSRCRIPVLPLPRSDVRLILDPPPPGHVRRRVHPGGVRGAAAAVVDRTEQSRTRRQLRTDQGDRLQNHRGQRSAAMAAGPPGSTHGTTGLLALILLHWLCLRLVGMRYRCTYMTVMGSRLYLFDETVIRHIKTCLVA